MPDTFIKIASVTVGSGGASSIDFTSIPSTYTDLCVKFSLRAGSNNCNLRFNGSSAASYGQKTLRGTGSAVDTYYSVNSGATEIYFQALSSTSDTANTFSNVELYIPNYAGSTNKSCSLDGVGENNGTTTYSNLIAGLWSNTAAITQVSVLSSFVQYSTATLYGIKNS